MNLICERQLDKSQKQVIYEITLKKRQCKKATMSEKQLAARQQLAHELMLERIIPIEDSILAHNRLLNQLESNSLETNTLASTSSSPSIATTLSNSTSNYDDQSIADSDQQVSQHSRSSNSCSSSSSSNRIAKRAPPSFDLTTTTSAGNSCCSGASGDATSSASSLNSSPSTASSQQSNQQFKFRQQEVMSSNSCNSCGCSFGRSDSSYSGLSQASSGSETLKMIDEMARQEEELHALKKEANIKFNKTRLEHLNEELERRLYQYEYLVTKEKALLGAYNLELFTNKGVNNFY